MRIERQPNSAEMIHTLKRILRRWSLLPAAFALCATGLLCSCNTTAPPKKKGPQASSSTLPWDRPTARHNNAGPLGSMMQRER